MKAILRCDKALEGAFFFRQRTRQKLGVANDKGGARGGSQRNEVEEKKLEGEVVKRTKKEQDDEVYVQKGGHICSNLKT